MRPRAPPSYIGNYWYVLIPIDKLALEDYNRREN